MKNTESDVKQTDPLFDGHPEKPIKDMTPSERLDYLWAMVEFRYIITNKIKLTTSKKNNEG